MNCTFVSVCSLCRCQTHEGGIGGYPGVEAHGGYTFCALAAMEILEQTQALDLRALLDWTVLRQMPLEGGFQGRTNKLVDGCYSMWVGGIHPILKQYSILDGLRGEWSLFALCIDLHL